VSPPRPSSVLSMDGLDQPPQLPDVSQTEAIKTEFERTGFSEAGLASRFTLTWKPPRCERYYPANFPGRSEAIDLLIRLFMVGCTEPRSLVEQQLSRSAYRALLDCRLLAAEGSDVRATAHVAPWAGFFLAADRRDALLEADHVISPDVSTSHVASRLLTLPEGASKQVLEVGTGSGVLALIARRTSERVIATDINERAIAFGKFNAAFNGVTSVHFERCACEEIGSLGLERQVDLYLFNSSGVFEVGTFRSIAFSVADGEGLLTSAYGSLPKLLTDEGRAVLRHELPSRPGYMEDLLVRVGAHEQLHVEHEVTPHHCELSELRSSLAVVRRRKAGEPGYVLEEVNDELPS